MRLIQAKVSDEQFKAFSHYLVDRDLTVAEAIAEWIESKCERVVVEADTTGSARGKRGLRAVEADAPKTVQVSNPDHPTTSSKKVAPEPVSEPRKVVSEYQCKACGKPTNGTFLCPKCQKL